jgi:copper chaperone CopZ
MIKLILAAGLVAVAAPVFAQDSHSSGTTYQDGHNSATTYKDGQKEIDPTASTLKMSDTPELTVALALGGEPIVAKVLGVVCEFCTKAMNKTFGKRDDVAAVYVDLDAKTLNLVMAPGKTFDDKTLRELVKKSGYKVETIARGEAVSTG